ncbi:MAG: undecaprenyl-diphosphate phosphatase [Roseburia sp.]|nr:undecaprenyl-diphosphate phosphatase [Roseburia sp.]
MSLLQAIFMGIIQGLTEFLPVSSSGHLALFKNLFGVKTETGLLFDVLLHLGTLIAIFVVYYKDLFRMIVEGCGILYDAALNVGTFFKNRLHHEELPYRRVIHNSYRKFVMLVIVSTIPTGIIGIVGSDLVEMSEQILIVPGICLIITGVLLLIAQHHPDGKKTPKTVTYSNAFGIGIAQGIATMPGLSRSGTTIAACMMSGFSHNFAVKYSFIMSIPAILGAVVKELIGASGIAVSHTEMLYYLIGTVIAGVVGYICMKTMLVVVRKKKFTGFSIYCFIIGAFSIGGYFYLN